MTPDDTLPGEEMPDLPDIADAPKVDAPKSEPKSHDDSDQPVPVTI